MVHTYRMVKKYFLLEWQSLSFNNVCLCLWIFGSFGRSVIGQLTLSPMNVAPVCDAGEPLQLTCRASVHFISWSIMVVNDQGVLEDITAFSNSIDTAQQSSSIVVNSSTFTFIRTSAQGSSPLVSTLTIDSVSMDLNGTAVHCMDANNPMTSASTTIHILSDINNTLVVTSEEYAAENVTVTVEWPRQLGAMYNIVVVPGVPISTLGQLTLLYNIKYNLSVVAVTPCGSTPAFIGLHYVNCGHPSLLSPDSQSFAPRIEGYDNLPVQGSTVRFSCSPGSVLMGSNSATCSENGRWELDPNGLTCIESNVTLNLSAAVCGYPLPYDPDNVIVIDYVAPAMEGTTVTFECPPRYGLIGPNGTTCMRNGEWEPDPSEVECRVTTAVHCGHPWILCDRGHSADSGPTLIIVNVDPTLEGTTVTFGCTPQYVLTGPNTTTCMGNGEWEPDPCDVECKGNSKFNTEESSDVLLVAVITTVVAFLVISLLAFIGGFVCGHYFGRMYHESSNDTSPSAAPVPLYEDVNDLELKENVAYGPPESMT